MSSKDLSKFEQWIFESYHLNLEGLGLFRIFAALFILFYGVPDSALYSFLSSLPDQFFAPPPGPMMLFNEFPSEFTFFLLHYLLIISLILLAAGVFTKYASISAGLLLLILKGFIYSLGKINHEMLLVAVPLVMAFSGWGKAYSIDFMCKRGEKSMPQNWTLTLLALIIGFMFFTAGFPKILGGWLDLQTQATQGHFFRQYFIHGRQELLTPLMISLPEYIWEVFDYLTVLFEVGFLFAILHPRSTRIFICFAVLFHFSTMMVLNIPFLINFVMYAAFLKWNWMNEQIIMLTERLRLKRNYLFWFPPLVIITLMVISLIFIQILANTLLIHSNVRMGGLFLISVAMLAALYYLIKELNNTFRKGKSYLIKNK